MIWMWLAADALACGGMFGPAPPESLNTSRWTPPAPLRSSTGWPITGGLSAPPVCPSRTTSARGDEDGAGSADDVVRARRRGRGPHRVEQRRTRHRDRRHRGPSSAWEDLLWDVGGERAGYVVTYRGPYEEQWVTRFDTWTVSEMHREDPILHFDPSARTRLLTRESRL